MSKLLLALTFALATVPGCGEKAQKRRHAKQRRAHTGRAERCFDRGVAGRGFLRQLAAVLEAPDRRPGLAGLKIPSLVIHGGHDPLVRPSGGLATARAIPGAEWLLFEPMGHDLPAPLWPAMIGAIHRTATRAL